MHGVALTSLWVAAWRAAESERPDALFHDPFARTLAGPEGFAVLEAARAAAPIEAPTILRQTGFVPRTPHARRFIAMEPFAPAGERRRSASRTASCRSSARDISHAAAGPCPPRKGVQ